MKPVLITSSILIVLIAALRPILRGRIDPRIQYALWLIAALRLLVPVELAPSAYSALALLERAEEPAQVMEAIGQTPIPVRSYQSAYDQALREYEQENGPITSDGGYGALQDYELVGYRATALMRGPTLAELAVKYARPVWLGGGLAMALWFLLVNLRLRRKLAQAQFIEAEPVSKLPVYVSGALPSPCLFGAFRPAIYVTPAAAGDPDRMRHVLAHEATHYRHRDHWWALVRCLCLCLYWFDPLVWWAAAMSRQDCELACDAGAIRRLGEQERLSYGRTLVAMVAAGRSSLLQTATTMTGGKRRVKQRVKLIARRPKTVIALTLAAALLVGCAVGCTFTGAPEKEAAPMGLSADSLRERLMDVPEELRTSVKASASEKTGVNDIAVVSYWWDVPAEWVSERSPWLLSVHQWERDAMTPHSSPEPVDGSMDIEELIAMNEEYYFTIERFPDARLKADDEAAFFAAYQAIRAYAQQQVLDTQGVEPYSPDTPNQPLDTLRARLEDIPEELRGEVALYHADAAQAGGADILATYLLDNAPNSDGWLLTVRQLDQVGFEDWLYSLDVGHTQIFARDSEHYYKVSWPTSVQYSDEDASRYAAASKAIWDYAKQAVLDTQGVEPYDSEELRSRDCLWEGKTYTDVAYWPYKNINGSTDILWVFRLVQLARDDEGGVWIPERYQIIDKEHGVDPTPQHIKPDTGGLTVTEYAAQLQAEADAGNADWAADPIQVCMRLAETDFGHSSANVTGDCFTRDGAYIERVLAGLLPSPEEQAVQAVADRLLAAPGLTLSLGPAGTSRVYTYPTAPIEDFYAYYLRDLATDFQWEAAPYSTSQAADFLRISSSDGTTSLFFSDGSYLMLVQQDGDTACYKGQPRETYNGYTAYDRMRRWFDQVELGILRAPSLTVDGSGQSHEEIAHKWALDYESAYLKCAPGSGYQCTFMQVIDVKADLPDFQGELLEAFAQDHHFSADDFGKTWFGFSYSTVFVPVDQSTANNFWAGNTWYYEGDADWAPEGALTYSRIGFMTLTDEGWTCQGVGTGW